jgi:hypothetical protein
VTVVISNHLGFDYGFAGKENSPSHPFRVPRAIKYIHTEDSFTDQFSSLPENRTNHSSLIRKTAALQMPIKVDSIKPPLMQTTLKEKGGNVAKWRGR